MAARLRPIRRRPARRRRLEKKLANDGSEDALNGKAVPLQLVTDDTGDNVPALHTLLRLS